MQFMLHRGLDLEFYPLHEAVHWVVDGSDASTDGRDVLPTLDFLVNEAGMSPNEQVGSRL